MTPLVSANYYVINDCNQWVRYLIIFIPHFQPTSYGWTVIEERYELQEWVWVRQSHRNPRMRKIQVWVTYGWCYKYEAIPDICFTTENHRAIESATGNLVIKRK